MKKKDTTLLEEAYDQVKTKSMGPILVVKHHGTRGDEAVTFEGPVSQIDGNAKFYESDYDISNLENYFQDFDLNNLPLEEMQELINPFIDDTVGGGGIDPENFGFTYSDDGKTLYVSLNDEEGLIFTLKS